MWLLDIFLPKETKNLEKINKLAERFNKLMENKEESIVEYSIIWWELARIETKEHKDKIELYLEMITHLIDKKLELWKH